MSKKERIEELYNKFKEYTKTAEQHEFPGLLFCDTLLTPAYKDLEKNWDESHADSFIMATTGVLKHFGIEV